MGDQRVICMIGLPGSGKSTYAKRISQENAGSMIVSADEFFVDKVTGRHVFQGHKIAQAHMVCQMRAMYAMTAGKSVIVDNTNLSTVEVNWWQALTRAICGKKVLFVATFVDHGDLTDSELADRCVHGVPPAKIAVMRQVLHMNSWVKKIPT